ncbi:MAG: Ca-activated chloride channel [Fimbriimonadaceae bacterium]|jgi:Ca-activated chloride channel family protein|nr:Ca-activated chloride channel [Fimbriimonadaceae bacterium]
MDPTQKIDPNKTMLTDMQNLQDPLRTPAMGAVDLGKTSAMDAFAPGGRALAIEVIPGRTATMANGPAREQFLLELHAGGSGGVGIRTPLNLGLVIDRSGSMEGPPLEYVKQACSHVVDMLNQDDVLSIVTFEQMVDVLMPPQRVTNKQMIKEGISHILAGNTTNLYEGMRVGFQQVIAGEQPGRATRLVVLTDGDPTEGIKNFQSIVGQAAEFKSRGITCTFLGFGPDYNEELLAAMAKRSGGNYYYIPRPEMIPEVFRTEMEKLLTTIARNLKLDLKLARWVSMRGPEQADSGEVTVSMADMERGSTIQQVIDLEFPNHPLGHYRVAGGRLSYDDGVTGRTESVDVDLVLEFSPDKARYSAPVEPRVAQASQIQMASRAVEKTIMGLKTQQISAAGAMQELQKTQALLLSQGRTQEAQEVTMALRALQSGDAGAAEKTLMGTMVNLDQGKV